MGFLQARGILDFPEDYLEPEIDEQESEDSDQPDEDEDWPPRPAPPGRRMHPLPRPPRQPLIRGAHRFMRGPEIVEQESEDSDQPDEDDDGPPSPAPRSPIPTRSSEDLEYSNWLTSISERTGAQPRRLTTSSTTKSCSIHRVPCCIRRHSEDAYAPQVVAIGPFHYYEKFCKLKPMEEHKWRYLKEIIPNIEGEHEPRGLLDLCLKAIRRREAKARKCYSEKIELRSQAFVEMMLLDGCFIIEFFRRSKERQKYPEDPIVKFSWLRRAIRMDLLLLENQIPFFIIESLCKVLGILDDFLNTWVYPLFVRTTEKAPNSTENEAKEHAPTFQPPLPSEGCPDHLADAPNVTKKEEKQKGERKSPRFQHLLHFLHCIQLPNWVDNSNATKEEEKESAPKCQRLLRFAPCLHLPIRVDTSNSTKEEEKENAPKFQHVLQFLPCLHSPNSVDKKPTKTMSEMIIPSASRLQKAGIKFQMGDLRSDIEFQDGVIKIPLLAVTDTAKSVLLNLVAFEQCYPQCKSYYSGYFFFLDCLIDNDKDVEILCEKRIINRWLNSDQEVAALFNKMGREIILNKSDENLIEVCKNINEFYGKSWNTWMTSLKRDYFKNPWTIIAVVAAAVLLLFTFGQTFFTAFPKFAYGN